MATDELRRYKRVRISPQYLTHLLNPADESFAEWNNGHPRPLREVITNDLPADARVVFVREDQTSDALVAFVHSATWPVIEPGAEVPELMVTYKVFVT